MDPSADTIELVLYSLIIGALVIGAVWLLLDGLNEVMRRKRGRR